MHRGTRQRTHTQGVHCPLTSVFSANVSLMNGMICACVCVGYKLDLSIGDTTTESNTLPSLSTATLSASSEKAASQPNLLISQRRKQEVENVEINIVDVHLPVH